MAKARENFEAALLAERVMLRSARRRTSPDEGTPWKTWGSAIKLLPQAIQRECRNPRERVDRANGEYSLKQEVALSRDSGISINVVNSYHTEEPDEDGFRGYDYSITLIDWEWWVGDKSEDSNDDPELKYWKKSIEEFEQALKEGDPEGHAKFTGKP